MRVAVGPLKTEHPLFTMQFGQAGRIWGPGAQSLVDLVHAIARGERAASAVPCRSWWWLS